jgi:hypothetical protein
MYNFVQEVTQKKLLVFSASKPLERRLAHHIYFFSCPTVVGEGGKILQIGTDLGSRLRHREGRDRDPPQIKKKPWPKVGSVWGKLEDS